MIDKLNLAFEDVRRGSRTAENELIQLGLHFKQTFQKTSTSEILKKFYRLYNQDHTIASQLRLSSHANEFYEHNGSAEIVEKDKLKLQSMHVIQKLLDLATRLTNESPYLKDQSFSSVILTKPDLVEKELDMDNPLGALHYGVYVHEPDKVKPFTRIRVYSDRDRNNEKFILGINIFDDQWKNIYWIRCCSVTTFCDSLSHIFESDEELTVITVSYSGQINLFKEGARNFSLSSVLQHEEILPIKTIRVEGQDFICTHEESDSYSKACTGMRAKGRRIPPSFIGFYEALNPLISAELLRPFLSYFKIIAS